MFGTNASLVLRYKDIHAFDITDITKIIISMYREG